jgi:hypothetical protein
LRQEVILSALASELDAETISKQAQAYASVLPAFNFESEQVTQMARTIVEDLERSGRLKEYDRIHRINTAARRAPTIDGLFKLYQALLDAKVIPKTT